MLELQIRNSVDFNRNVQNRIFDLLQMLFTEFMFNIAVLLFLLLLSYYDSIALSFILLLKQSRLRDYIL